MNAHDQEKAARAREQYLESCREELAMHEETEPFFRDNPAAHERFGKADSLRIADIKARKIEYLRWVLR